ncbi:MAG TPA: hypothetical protein VG939_14465 [Caulobacteraceae bacterium]|nr:hypothetical protein [Caulobacteraceae bacterium]
MEVSPRMGAAFGLAIQFLVGGLLFAALGSVAVGLHVGLVFCHAHQLMPQFVESGMAFLELLVWGADVACFTLFIAVEVWSFSGKMIKEFRG